LIEESKLKNGAQEKLIAILDPSTSSITDYDHVILIPGEGCGGCISSATHFVRGNLNELERTMVVFTGIKDMKLVTIQQP
jgi:hypothetical protein